VRLCCLEARLFNSRGRFHRLLDVSEGVVRSSDIACNQNPGRTKGTIR
jgi:hypothetical protein